MEEPKIIRPLILTQADFINPVGFQVSYLNQMPHNKQKEVLLSSNKNKIIVCGRRSGKSQMVAAELIRGAMVVPEFKKQILIAPTYKQAMIVYYKINEIMYKSGVIGDVDKFVKSPHPQIKFKSGGIIDFGSADNPDSLRGEAYGRIFLDESAFIKEGAMHAIKPLSYDTGAPVWETTTPWGKGEVWERWRRGKKGDEDYGCFHYNYKDNPYLSPEGVKEIEKDILEWGEDSVYVQCEIYGNFAEDRDAYFSQELIDKCVDEYELGVFHPKSQFVLGVDIAGMGEDESVFMVVEKDYRGRIRVNFIDNYLKNKPREVVGKCTILNGKYNFEMVYLDETGAGEGPTDWLKENMGEEIVEGVRFSVKSKMDMYSNLKKLMQQGKLKIPNHKKLLYQLADLKYEMISSGDMKIHHSVSGHDDYCDALALACLWFKDDSDSYDAFIM